MNKERKSNGNLVEYNIQFEGCNLDFGKAYKIKLNQVFAQIPQNLYPRDGNSKFPHDTKSNRKIFKTKELF